MNLYAYVRNNPIRFLDPLGFTAITFGVPYQTANDIYNNLTAPVIEADLAPGDLFFYDWNNDGIMDHVVTFDGTDRIWPSGGPANNLDNPGTILRRPGTGTGGEYRRID